MKQRCRDKHVFLWWDECGGNMPVGRELRVKRAVSILYVPQTRGATVRSRLCALACRGVVYSPAWALLVWRLGMVAMWGQLPGHAPEPLGCNVWCASRLSRGRPRCRDSSLDTRLNLGGVMVAVRGQ